MKLDGSLCILFDLKLSYIQFIEDSCPPTIQGQTNPQEEVSVHIIGHWLDIVGDDNTALYRCFIHNKLPYGEDNIFRLHRKLLRARKPISLNVPYFSGASEIVLYEQSYMENHSRALSRRELFRHSIVLSDKKIAV